MPTQAAAHRDMRVWGLGVREAHDRLWASRGVQVIRPGGADADPRGPRLYLLLGESDLVFFALAPLVKRLNWIKPRVMRLRLVDKTASAYVERVLAGDGDRFLAIRRQYRASTRSTLRAGLSGDARVARMWRESAGGRQAWRDITTRVGRARVSVSDASARILRAGGEGRAAPGEEAHQMARVLAAWKDPTAALDGVYEFQPGVLLHESVRTPPGVRFVGSVWAGAGVRFEPGQVVIGPRVLADAPGSPVAARPVSWDANPHPGWRPVGRLRGKPFRITKRLFDIGFSAAVLVATSPLYPLVMLAITIEDGWPVFFAHRRQTRRGREFPCYKFRTMCKDAEKMKKQLAQANQADGPQFFIENDPRLLRVGRFLRRHQLDELPQFWNVLRGDMSVVGPRPSPDKENQYCPAWREARLSVRPGVTGLWQVRRTRAPETDFQEWIRYDLEYVQHESWRLDLWIIFMTIAKVFRG